MNYLEKQASNRKRCSSAGNDESLGPPLKITRKLLGNDMDEKHQAQVEGSVAVAMSGMSETMPDVTVASEGEVQSPYSVSSSGKECEWTSRQPTVVTPPKSPSADGDKVVMDQLDVSMIKASISILSKRDLQARSDSQSDLTPVVKRQAVDAVQGSKQAVCDANKTLAPVTIASDNDGDDASESVYSIFAGGLAAVNDFFHARAGPEGCILGGWMRIGYAFLFTMDRLLWSRELSHFYYNSGVLPARVSRQYSYIEPENHLTIFQLAPESDWLVWTVNYLCLLQGILLFLGVVPRFQVACLVIYLASFEHLNDHVWDSQDVMLRFFGFLLCFMPLHRFTIYEWWQTRDMTKEQKDARYTNDSWPMWPFRLFQIEICFIYAGAGLSKLSNKAWRTGLAVYYASFTNHFGGIFTPDFIFNRIGPLKIMTYGSLFVECVAWITVWYPATRLVSLISIVLLHVGIDLSMNMHIFEWLSILGWMSFLARPREVDEKKDEGNEVANDNYDSKETIKSSRFPTGATFRRLLVNIFIATFLIVYASETFPIYSVKSMTPETCKPAVRSIQSAMEHVSEIAKPWTHRFGIHQETWSMFGSPVKKSEYYEAFIRFKDGNKTKWYSPDWKSMSWFERKLNRRRQLYFNNLMDFHEEDTIGHERLCEWIAKQYSTATKQVERVKLVYHYTGAKKPRANLQWFDKVDRSNVKTWKETHYILYTQEACDEWASEGECMMDTEFMVKRCAKSCEGVLDNAKNVTLGSRVLVHRDDGFYSASILKVKKKKKKAKRFLLKWDFREFGSEWFDLNKNAFTFLGEDKVVSSHKQLKAEPRSHGNKENKASNEKFARKEL